jgi:hypothetical protein
MCTDWVQTSNVQKEKKVRRITELFVSILPEDDQQK